MKGFFSAVVPPAPCLHCQLPDPEHLWLCEGCRASLAPVTGAPTTLEGGLSVESGFFYGGACSVLVPFAKSPVEPPLYQWLISQLPGLPEGSALVPIPSHWRRRIERGGCHTTALAQALAFRLDIPVIHGLERIQLGPKQSQLDSARRREIRSDHFRTRNVEFPPGRILLIDDVMTTGSTLRSAAQAFLRTHEVDDLAAWVLTRRV